MSLPRPREFLRVPDNDKVLRMALCGISRSNEVPSIEDPLHPSHFVQILERTWEGDFLPLFQHGDPDIDTTLTARREVDERSTIVVRFDRQHLISYASHSNFTVRVAATVQTGEETPPVEVLGYQELGTESGPSAAAVAASARLLGQLCDVALNFGADAPPFAQFVALANVSVDTLGLLPPGTSELPPDTQNSLRAQLDSLRNEWQIEAAEMGSGLLGLASWASALDTLGHLPDAQLQPVTSSANTTPGAFRAWINEMKSAADSLRDYSRRGELREDTRRAEGVIQNFADAFSLLNPFLRALDEGLVDKDPVEEFARQLIYNLRDGEIPLLAQGIREGSTVTVTVSNAIDGTEVPRAMRLQFLVRRFGINPAPTIRDSFLFLNRWDVQEGARPAAGVDSAADPVNDARTPLPARGLPTAGTSVVWSIYPRGSNVLARAARIFEPGLGINISFPQFGTTVTSVTEVADGTSGRVVTSTVSDQSIGLGVGVLALLGDGLFQVTVGYNVSVREHPWYWGFGFSFVKIGQELGATN